MEAPRQIAQRHASCGPPRPGQAGLDGRELEGQGVRVHRLRRAGRMKQARSFMYASTSCTCPWAAGELELAQGL